MKRALWWAFVAYSMGVIIVTVILTVPR